MLTVAHLADLHLDAPFAQFGVDAQQKRQTAIEEAFKQALAEANARDADLLVIAGDLYEQASFTPSTANFLRDRLGEFQKRVFIAPGNHDYYSPESLYATVDWPSNVHVFEEERLEPFSVEDGLTIWGAAHTVPTTHVNFLDGRGVDRGGVHLAVFHGAEESELAFVHQLGGDDKLKSPYAPFRAEQIAAAGLHHAFLGHLHTPRDGERHTYPGNPEPLTFGERGDLQRGLVIAIFDDSGRLTNRERIKVAQCAVSELPVDLTDCDSNDDIRERFTERLAGVHGFVRITLKGEIGVAAEVNRAELREIALQHVDGVALQVRDLHVAYPIDEIAKETDTVRGRFVNDVLESDELDDEMKRRAIVTGLRALDGRPDLAVL
jgi:exonuclease SbcD